MTKLTALLLICLTTTPTLSSEPVSVTINTKKWSHVLDDHFISITVNPTDLLQGKVYGLAMNSTLAILKGLAPAYVRIGSADTGKYVFKRNRHLSDVMKPDDEYTVTETHWMVFNEVAQSAGLDVIVCLNAGHRIEGTKKWDSRNSLELISFSDSQGYNLTWQLGYEVQPEDFSGMQFGKDLNRLRTILNAFPRYQDSKLIGPDIRVIHKKEDVDFWNDVLVEAGPILDAVTWHPRWPQPSKMKVSDNSDLGYEFPIDHLEWDRSQLNKILQKNTFKNPVWIGETKRESTGTFAEGLIWARRLVLAAKLGVEVVMKHPNLMDITHPKPEYWIALLHKRLLGKSVLETRNVANQTDLTVISHCTNPSYWMDKPEKLQDGPVTVYAVNMGGLEQKIQLKGTWTGKSQLLFQYVLTSGSDPDSIFSQMTYLNGEPLMMTDDGQLPDIIPKIKKMERGLTLKLPPYSIGFWVVPEAKVKICQVSIPPSTVEHLSQSSATKTSPNNLQNIRDINQFLVEKLTHPESESEETPELKIEPASSESSEKDISLLSKENALPRVARRIRQVDGLDELNQQLKTIVKETHEFLNQPGPKHMTPKSKLPKGSLTTEERIQHLAEGISQAIKTTNQEEEFNKFLEDSGLNRDFGGLLMNGKKPFAPPQPFFNSENNVEELEIKTRLRRSISEEDERSHPVKFGKKIKLVEEPEEYENRKPDMFIPHNPDLKGLEERYKSIVHSKIKDGRRKIDDIKRKIKDETEIKSPEAVNDIQEEIIKKEIELLEKTEEAVADILKNQKKRQETLEEMIFDEIKDVKGEKMTVLKEMHKDNTIVKRQAPGPLPKPLLKTVEYIEKNFNLEPDSVRKIKRSLEERMGEILRNYDTRKSMESKPRMKPQKEERKTTIRKIVNDDERKETIRGGLNDDKMLTKERPNLIKKTATSQQSHHTVKSVKKNEGSQETPKERSHRGRRVEDSKWKNDDEDDSFEMFNKSKFQDTVTKAERRRPEMSEEKTTRWMKKSSKVSQKDEKHEEDTRKKQKDVEEESKRSSQIKRKFEEEEKKVKRDEVKKEHKPEQTPLKHDKERREHMLKQITMMVDHMNSKERTEGRSKRKNADEDISEEFDTDKRLKKIKRRPREAAFSELKEETLEMRKEKPMGEMKEIQPLVALNTATTQPPVTTPKIAKRRRNRPNRKQKESKKITKKEDDGGMEEESQQRKRHLASLDRPVLDLEKKKFIKPKMKKVSPKFLSHGNDLLMKEKEMEWNHPPVEDTPKTPEPTDTKVMNQNEELLKDLEEIAEEKIFLGRGSGTSKEKLETSGKESSKTKETEMDTSGETPAPTEGYIVVEPTVEPEVEDIVTSVDQADGKKNEEKVEETERTQEEAKDEKLNSKMVEKNDDVKLDSKMVEKNDDVKLDSKIVEKNDDVKLDSKIVEKKDDVKFNSKIEKNDDLKLESKIGEKKEVPVAETKEEKKDVEEDKKDFISIEEIKSMEEDPKSAFLSGESSSSEEMEDVEPPILIRHPMDPRKPSTKVGVDTSQRTRRATFLPNHKKEEEDEDDYSSEERIEKFKQMIYRKSPTKKPIKNEIRSTSGMGMGADEFLRMAGSTVRVMFDDVIPEAYGQTKNKIQNMGIPEYIKEFGKIVQQMKNLDQIFLNIGEAAVKGYIRGNRADKGPYVQVIGRKKRGVAKDTVPPEKETFLESVSTTEASTDRGGGEYATTSKEEERSAGRWSPWEVSSTGGIFREGVHEVAETRTDHAAKIADIETSETSETAEATQTGEATETAGGARTEEKEQKKEVPRQKLTAEETNPLFDLETLTNPIKTLHNTIPKIVKSIQPKTKQNDAVIWKNPQLPEELHDKLSPWIKTTKDFIEQALTTLQRQRQLSEILARESINTMKKSIEKREAGNEEPQLPVYHMVPPNQQKETKKREAREKQSDESLIRQLRGLQPGVYVVPTEEMTNIRSEQITNEAQQKSGVPNVVTLNIYYDKKNQDGSGKFESTGEATEAKLNQDVITYYQNKAWKTAADQYDPNTQYLSVPEMSLPNPLITPMQVNPSTVFTPEPRVADLPNSRLIQYPSPTYHYPPVQKVYPSIVPNPQPVYNPVYYLPQENRFIPPPPGTKRQWREFKARTGGFPAPSYNSGWNIQYETVPGSVRTSSKVIPSSYNKNFKLYADKKRSVGDFKVDPTWSESALPFWKFFTTADSKKMKKTETKNSLEKQEAETVEEESSEDVFAENRKRAKAIESQKSEEKAPETETEEPVPEEEEEEDKSRKRRSLDDDDIRHPKKRSYTYGMEFRDHDILPEWFGTYQEIGNSLDHLPTHVRRSQIISTPWSDEDEELLNILEAQDEDNLSLMDLDDSDDYYYSNDNTIGHLKRYPRSTDQFDSNMIKSNMIYKKPVDSDHVKSKILGMSGVKKLTDEDSSLELVTKTVPPPTPETSKQPTQETTTQPTTASPTTNTNQSQPFIPLPRNPHDDTFYYFFKYAYDSLVKVMKSMTQLF